MVGAVFVCAWFFATHYSAVADKGRAMSEARVKAKFWVQAALRLGEQSAKPGMVVRSGDPDAGGILVVLRSRKGLTVLSQVRAGEGDAAWMRASGPEPVDEAAADAYVARQVNRDPDLWVIEFEAPDALPPFQGRII
jgi:hypothetical protein